ncbi:uncharacterized protein BO87DRAFT_30055 [Aspergillus neoniger CBS 115656]|uniref:Uncharacterized protein n=1 Tax=Aspergillus neoniger (strain CBS 115656) TaxID=1448310 RepID=A0A318YLJ5_ASPNB|nr:hypothetical protein BO87DRAFT_30055 [Aspergillus neoniger CBS 115656]PYH35461.1 hypothetical protein BO87DRAFT_30055 [Aspergillus neoniger CBS 115656]
MRWLVPVYREICSGSLTYPLTLLASLRGGILCVLASLQSHQYQLQISGSTTYKLCHLLGLPLCRYSLLVMSPPVYGRCPSGY